jgi:hypothetical protein
MNLEPFVTFTVGKKPSVPFERVAATVLGGRAVQLRNARPQSWLARELLAALHEALLGAYAAGDRERIWCLKAQLDQALRARGQVITGL